MNNEVLVTIRCNTFCEDFQLPTDVRLSELRPRLLKMLKSVAPQHFGSCSGINLAISSGRLADDDATLAHYGVCSGSYIDITKV